MTAYSSVSSLKYEESVISLGDELRSARAARGLSISDVEADLRIRAHYIEAIESADVSNLPDKVYVDGFVRNYAGYLGLDANDVLRRFSEETGQALPASGGLRRRKKKQSDDPLAGYVARPSKNSSTGSAVRGIVSLWPIVVLGLIGAGVWFGVKAARDAGMIPENLSVIGGIEQTEPVIEASLADSSIDGDVGGQTIERPADLSYAKLGTQPYWDDNQSDGPLSMIDKDSVGLFTPESKISELAVTADSAFDDGTTAQDTAAAFTDDIAAMTRAALSAELNRAFVAGEASSDDEEANVSDDTTPAQDNAAPSDTALDFALVATQETWIEVKGSSGSIRFSGILAPGDSYDLTDTNALTLKVGNAGGLSVELQGQRLGPFGKNGAVVRSIPLDRDALVERFAEAATAEIQ